MSNERLIIEKDKTQVMCGVKGCDEYGAIYFQGTLICHKHYNHVMLNNVRKGNR